MRSSPSTTKRSSLPRRASTIASEVSWRSSSSSSAIRIGTAPCGLGVDKGTLLLGDALCPGVVTRRLGCGLHRERDREGGALARPALGGDGPAVALGDPPAQGQADACADVLGLAVQPLEHPEYALGIALLEADAVVAH